MDLESVLRRFAELFAGRGTPAASFDVNAAIARTQLKGLPVARDASGAYALFAASEPPATPQQPSGAVVLGFVRSRPLQGSFDVFAAPEWARGMAVAQSSGPVLDAQGIPSWIDTIVPVPKQIEVARVTSTSPIAYVQSASVSQKIVAGRTVVTFGPGSVWFVAPLLAKAAPSNGFAGIAFTSATLSVPGAFAPSTDAGVMLLAAAQDGTLELAPVQGATSAPGLVNDGASALAKLPATVSFTLLPGAVNVTALADAELTAYGRLAQLRGGPAQVTYDPDAAEIAVGYRAVTPPREIAIASSASPTFELRGSAKVAAGSYRFPVALTTADALGPAASGGALGLALGAGLRGRWGNLDAPVAFGPALLHVQTGTLGVLARTIARPFADSYALWDARSAAGETQAATVALDGPRGTVLRIAESAQSEIVLASGCTLDAHLDRPLLATGAPPALSRLTAAYALIRIAADTYLFIEGAYVPPFTIAVVPQPIQSYVIENAVLRTRGVDALLAFAKLTAQRAAQGVLLLHSPLDLVIPILPDPYAAIDPRAEAVSESLLARVAWISPSAAQLAFDIQRALQSGTTTEAASLLARGDGPALLYDVSSEQSQFGVGASAAGLAGAQIVGQKLAVSGQQSALFTVPAIAWEPVLNPERRYFFPVAPDQGQAFAADDGPLALVNVESVTLRPLEPGALLDAFVADYAKGADLLAEVTLPFGLTATVDTNASRNTSPPIPRPVLLAAEPNFTTAGKGGRQLSVRATYDAKNQRAVLPGRSNAGDPVVIPPSPSESPDSSYVHAILDDTANHDMANFWNQDFNAQLAGAPGTHFVPVSRYDLSGYGASVFSNYVVPGFAVGISQARFDVIVGRVSYTLVQEQSYILPWFIPVVNTTIFERDATGYILRYNSGWQAKTDGLFAFPGVDPAKDVERGGILGVFNIHNIVEQPGILPLGAKQFSRVTFDGNIHLAVGGTNGLTVTGGDPLGAIPSSGLSGYLDLTAHDTPSVAEAIQLIDTFGIANGPLAAEIVVTTNGLTMGLTGVEVDATRPDVVRPGPLPRTLAVALRGTPHLPRDGAWSLGTRIASSTVPQPLAPTVPVPLVRAVATPNVWHIADAGDVVQLDTPRTYYGFLQATGTTKSFFEQPKIANVAGANPLNFGQTPKLADVGKLLGDNGLLPDILSLLDFGAFDGLKPSGDGFALKKTLENDVDLGKRVLLPLGIVTLYMESWSDPPKAKGTHIKLDLDASATPRWAISISGIAFKLVVDGWGDESDPLIIVHGDASVQDGGKPTFSNLGVKYGSSLAEIQQILTEVEQFIEFLPSKQKTGLDVSFVGTKLRIREAFPLPKLPLGLGYIEDFSLDLGFDIDVLDKSLSFFVGLGDDQDPFHWLVSPLSGNGMLQLGASDQLGVVMQAGIGVGLAIDFAIVSGSASIVLAVRFDTTNNPIGVMVLLTGQASVDVLEGLASASLTLTAGVGVAVQPGPAHLLTDIPPDPIEFLKETVVTLSAEVAVGIHISICWVVHVDFDGSWPFSETISGKTLTSLV